MGFYFRITNIKIRTGIFFVPDEVFAPQLKQPFVNHLIVISPDGSYMPLDILIPRLLRGVADILYVAKLRNPYHPSLEKSPDHYLIVVRNMELLIVPPYGFIKGLFPSPYVVRG
jgi:hypothetical protein